MERRAQERMKAEGEEERKGQERQRVNEKKDQPPPAELLDSVEQSWQPLSTRSDYPNKLEGKSQFGDKGERPC